MDVVCTGCILTQAKTRQMKCVLITLQAKLLLDAYRKKTAARLDKIPGLVIQRQQRLKADLAAIGELKSAKRSA